MNKMDETEKNEEILLKREKTGREFPVTVNSPFFIT
jgi:intein/homing endonuclease